MEKTNNIKSVNKDCICIKGKNMTMLDAQKKGYITLLPYKQWDHDFEEGYHDFAYEHPEEEILTSLDPETEMVSMGKGKKAISLAEQSKRNWSGLSVQT